MMASNRPRSASSQIVGCPPFRTRMSDKQQCRPKTFPHGADRDRMGHRRRMRVAQIAPQPAPFEGKTNSGRMRRPTLLERSNQRVDRELRRKRQRLARADRSPKADRRISPHARTVSDDLAILLGNLSHQRCRVRQLVILIPVVLRRNEMDRINIPAVKKFFAEAPDVGTARIGVMIKGYDELVRREPTDVANHQIWRCKNC